MELKHLFVFFAGFYATFVAAMKIIENQKLKREIRLLREKLGKTENEPLIRNRFLWSK